MKITATYIEDTIAMLGRNDPAGLDEANNIMEHASSDDFKDRFADELFDLAVAIENFGA